MIVENTASPRAKKAIQQKISLFNILTCLLCSSKAKMAHICPNCSKFYCEGCIKQWIKQGNNQCPNCQSYISQSSIVNCNKLSQDLSNALQALIQLQPQNQTLCQAHNISQTYYCQNCVSSICSDCIVLQIKHRGHNVIKLSKVKIDFNQQILSQLSRIRKSIKDIQKMREQKAHSKNNYAQQSKLKLDFLNIHTQKIRGYYEQLTNGIIQKGEAWHRDNRLVFLSSSKIYQQFFYQLKQISKVQLVKRSHHKFEQIHKVIEEVDGKFIGKHEIQNIKQCESASLVCEKYAQKTFVLNKYTQCREKQDVIYSDTFKHGQLEWRLKIYPNGVPKKIGQPILKRSSSTSSFGEEYISIYIELVSSVREIGRYRFSIGILCQNDESKVISQVYEAEFDAGKCWGYDQFANISSLYQKGYINQEEDSLKIKVQVGPPSYFFSILDKDAMISKRVQKINENSLKIQKLKMALAIKNSTIRISASQAMKQSTSVKQIKELKQQKLQKISHQHQHQHQHENENKNQIQLQNIKTPRCKLPQKQQIKGEGLIESINYKNYIAQPPPEQPMRCSEQFDHQSAQLRKIYRRIANINDKSNLLLF